MPANAAAILESRFATGRIRRLAGLTSRQIRHYVRIGLVAPTRRPGVGFSFSFRDLVLLRAAGALRLAPMSMRRANRALCALKRRAGADRALAAWRIEVAGDAVVVRDAQVRWEVESGQGLLDFDRDGTGPAGHAVVRTLDRPQPAAARALELERAVAMLAEQEADGFSAEDWYNLGVALEPVHPGDARRAYRRALDRNPTLVDAWVNLGRLLQLDGEREAARTHYGHALGLEPDHQVAHYNLGTTFDEDEQVDAAMACYQRAPDIADAHYNLARIHEMRGDELSARRHLRAFDRLERGAPVR